MSTPTLRRDRTGHRASGRFLPVVPNEVRQLDLRQRGAPELGKYLSCIDPPALRQNDEIAASNSGHSREKGIEAMYEYAQAMTISVSLG